MTIDPLTAKIEQTNRPSPQTGQPLMDACMIRELDPLTYFGPNTEVSDSYPVPIVLTMGQIRAIRAAADVHSRYSRYRSGEEMSRERFLDRE